MKDGAASSQVFSEIKKNWAELLERGEILSFKPGQTVFYESHRPVGAFLLCSGTVRLCKSKDPSFSKDVSADGHTILGMDYLLSEMPYDYSAQATTETQLCYLPKSEILSLLPSKTRPPK